MTMIAGNDVVITVNPRAQRTQQPCKRLGCLLALVLYIAAQAGRTAVPMRFERLGLDAGLSELAVNVIGQDPSGFVWIGTEDGLNRYDGYRFVHFTHDPRDASSVPDNYITDMCFDGAGRQWIATDGGGISRRDGGSSVFVPLRTGRSFDARDDLNHVRVIRADHAGRIWIGTRSGGVTVVDARGSVSRYVKRPGAAAGLLDDSILAFAESATGAMWVGSDGGVDLLDLRLQKILLRLPINRLGVGGGVRIRSLLEDASGVLWIGTEQGLRQYRPVTNAVTPVSTAVMGMPAEAALTVETLYQDHGRRLWVGTSAGLMRFDAGKGTFDVYRNDPSDAESLPDNHVMSLFEDRSGLLWVGTKFGGIAKWNPRSWSFGHRRPDVNSNADARNVMSFAQGADGRIWIGTMGGGLLVTDAEGVETLSLRATGSQPTLSDDRVMALLVDDSGFLWAGLMEGALERISTTSLAVTHYQHHPGDPRSVAANGVMSLFQDSRKRIWIGTYGGGLSRYEPGSDTFRNYELDPNDPARVHSGRVTALAEDRRGRIWAGTDGDGIAILTPETGRLLRVRHNAAQPGSLSSDAIFALYIDSSGTAWIGTRGAGLDFTTSTLSDTGSPAFHNLSERDGLPNNSIYGIVPDLRGNLWLSTNHGLARLDPATLKVAVFRRNHGLQADEFNFGAHLRARNGRLLFGGPNGYNVFDPERLQIDPLPPAVSLTGITALGRSLYGPASYEYLQRVHFKHTDDVVTFEFAALDFTAPAANIFAYRLEGFDGGWNYAGSRAAATYTHLPGGRYVLHVRAANADGVWNSEGLRLAVEMDPPPWKTWYAYSAYALCFLAMLTWLWRRRQLEIARQAAHRRELEEQVRTRTGELAQKNVALREANTLLEAASFTDPLTGLGNRRSLDVAVPQLIESIKRDSRREDSSVRLAVLLVDLDRLKPINDQYGHEAGDRLLKEVSGILRDCVREGDKIVRWGGDEFVIVHRVQNLDGAAFLAERIRRTVAKRRFQVGASEAGRTSCSIGFALYPFAPAQFAELGWEKALGVADANMYRAKMTRNSWVGCAGIRPGMRPGEPESQAQKDLEVAEREGIIAVVRSGRTDGETVNLLLRRPLPQSRP